MPYLLMVVSRLSAMSIPEEHAILTDCLICGAQRGRPCEDAGQNDARTKTTTWAYEGESQQHPILSMGWKGGSVTLRVCETCDCESSKRIALTCGCVLFSRHDANTRSGEFYLQMNLAMFACENRKN